MTQDVRFASQIEVCNSLRSQVPFEKNCRANDTCIAELEVDFNFAYVQRLLNQHISHHYSRTRVTERDLPSYRTPTLVVVNHNNFNVAVRLSNHGDDSFNTKLFIFYPAGLSFSMLNVSTVTCPNKRISSHVQHMRLFFVFNIFFLRWIQQSTRPTSLSCKDLEGVLDRTECGISLPVYYSGTSVSSVPQNTASLGDRTIHSFAKSHVTHRTLSWKEYA